MGLEPSLVFFATKASRSACSAGLNAAGFCASLLPQRAPNLGLGEFESASLFEIVGSGDVSGELKVTSDVRKLRRVVSTGEKTGRGLAAYSTP